MRCPICGGVAKDITRHDYDGLAVRCRNCGDFEIAGTTLKDLVQLDETGRAAALGKAKRFASLGARPTISTTCIG
jgi:hypothetical protein